MQNMVKIKEGQIIVSSRAEENWQGRVLVWVSLGLAVIFLILAYIFNSLFLFMFPVSLGTLILVGLVFAFIGKKTVISLNTRRIQGPGFDISVDEVGSIMMWTDDIDVPAQHGFTLKEQHWILGFNSKEAYRKLNESIKSFKKLETEFLAEIAEKEGELTEEQQEQVNRELTKIDDAMEEENYLLGIQKKEFTVWQAAEQLAKALNLPVLDYSGESPVKREVSDLDLSMQEQIKQGFVEVTDPGQPPAGISIRSDFESLVLKWTFNQFQGRTFDLLCLLFIFLFLIGAGIVVGVEFNPFASLFMLVPALSLPITMLFFPKGRGRNKLEITPDSITHSCSMFTQKPRHMKLSKIKRVSVETGYPAPRPLLKCMSDEEIIACPMSLEQALWIRDRIQYYLQSLNRV
ncbi:MAG: hypothetical protein GY754_17835 [bacterium]|nr:hypothetical protein [bacterium]